MTFDSRGVAYPKTKNYPAAIAYYDAALKISAHLPSSLYGRGLAKAATGDATGSEADIAAAKT